MDEIIRTNKPKLIRWLRGETNMILQYVQSGKLVTDSEYARLKSIRDGEEKVTELLDIIRSKGEQMCGDFLNLLKQKEVNEFSPPLKEWINTVNTSAQNGDPKAKKRQHGNDQIQDCQKFLENNARELIQKVQNIDVILDDLHLHSEAKANVRAEKTNQDKMRRLRNYVNCQQIAKDLVNALFEHENGLMTDLLNKGEDCF